MAAMFVIAVVVYMALFFLKAGYGYLSTSNWGPKISNKAAWVIMEAPSFLFMLYYTCRFAALDIDTGDDRTVLYVMAGFFLLHYFQRSFIFPFLMRGKSKMPISIMAMGMVFNTLNSYFIAGWLFGSVVPFGPESRLPYNVVYTGAWFYSPQFIIGTLVFLAGMLINLDSDHVIRHLRKPGDTRHYIPKKHLYKYVTSANYFGEFTEWVGYAILTWSPAGLLFAVWTFANLAPRAKSLTAKYEEEFGDEYREMKKKHLIPFIW